MSRSLGMRKRTQRPLRTLSKHSVSSPQQARRGRQRRRQRVLAARFQGALVPDQVPDQVILSRPESACVVSGAPVG